MTSDKGMLRSIREALDLREDERLSPHATRNAAALRRTREETLDEGYRQAFSVDVDRILYSRAYARYIDKTQVFYLIRNDHITHRVLHVQLVSKIGRTIGRFLGLNEDLIEAIALGHDIGHTPFGHDGERFLSELCVEHGIGEFHHNVQSVRFLDTVERKGQGWNLCLQTLDGILCHDGEVHNQVLAPHRDKSFALLEAQMQARARDRATELMPMTLEGCVVRMADTVAYIGRDIEDAIRLGLIGRAELPGECTRLLGTSNGTIVFNLVTDILRSSHERGHVQLSPPVSEALQALKRFNLEHIYLNPKMKPHANLIRDLFRRIFERFREDLERERTDSLIFTGYLKGMSEGYRRDHHPAEIVRDYIAGMTDQYFLGFCPEHLRPGFIDAAEPVPGILDGEDGSA